MSDLKTIIKTRFINRRTGQTITSIPEQNNINITIDIRTLTTTFDFDILFRFGERIDIRSHDFIEFYYDLPNNGGEFQVACGFIEDFVRETGDNKLRFQGNGRDFLGQLFNLPFLSARPNNNTTITSFIASSLYNSYLLEYLNLKGIKKTISNKGAYGGLLIIPQLAGAKIAPVIQQMTDEIFNVVYQNRKGQCVIWGRSFLDEAAFQTNLQFTDSQDVNVNDFVVRQNYSRVISSCKVLYTGGEQNVDYALQTTKGVFNSDPRARQIFQPEVRVFQTSTLVTYSGQTGIDDARYRLAASILRKSNQNLNQVIIKTTRPYFVTEKGQFLPYETQQVYQVKSLEHKVDEKMKIVGLNYNQSADGLNVQVAMIPKDTLV